LNIDDLFLLSIAESPVEIQPNNGITTGLYFRNTSYRTVFYLLNDSGRIDDQFGFSSQFKNRLDYWN